MGFIHRIGENIYSYEKNAYRLPIMELRRGLREASNAGGGGGIEREWEWGAGREGGEAGVADRALFGIRCASVCYVPYGDLANHTLLSHRRHPRHCLLALMRPIRVSLLRLRFVRDARMILQPRLCVYIDI